MAIEKKDLQVLIVREINLAWIAGFEHGREMAAVRAQAFEPAHVGIAAAIRKLEPPS